MKRFIPVFLIGIIAAVSCDIYTSGYEEPDEFEPQSLDVTTTIKDLKAMYEGKALYINDYTVIGGQVISSDQSGNLYRTMYIQDETGAIELKLGKSYLYSDYKLGQWVYVQCQGLTLGQYGGMVQIGYEDQSGEYETAYMDVDYLISSHVVKGAYDELPDPVELTDANITDEDYWGMYSKVTGLTYGNQIFTILYDDADNSTYLSSSGTNYGVTSWAMSENGFKAYMTATTGTVEPQSAFNGAITKDVWQAYYDAAAAYSVSQYFVRNSIDLQVRTSGYAKFADTDIDDTILNGSKVTLTGILTHYNSNNQFLLLDLDGVEIE